MTQRNPIAVFSFPRSGRGFTRKIFYKNGYSAGDFNFREGEFFQTHDFKSDEVVDDRPNIVLARDPVYSMVSWFELDVSNDGRPDTQQAFWHSVEKEWSEYWKAFARRNILSGRCPVLWFNWFTANPNDYRRFLEKTVGHKLLMPGGHKAKPKREVGDFKHWGKGGMDRLKKMLEPEYSRVMNLGGPFA